MFQLKARSTMICAGFLLAYAGVNPVLADVPGAMDRVPTGAALIVSVKDMDQFRSRAEDLAKTLKAPIDEKDEKNPVNMTKKLLAADGLNKHGSMAVVVMPDKDGHVDFDQKDGPVVIVIPVTDYAAFAKGMGAEDTKGVASIKVDGNPAYAKDLGGGYAAMGPHKELLEAFEGKAGNLEKHKSSMGKTGQAIADRSDIIFVMNVAAMKPQLEEAVGDMKDNLKGMGAMAAQGAEQAEAMFGLIGNIADSFVRDAQVGIAGLGLGEGGVSLDFGAQYKEGSQSAKTLSGGGNASKFLGYVPNQPFLFAFAMDLSSPGIKQVVKDMAAVSAKDKNNPLSGVGSMAALTKSIDKVDGMSSCMGASPAGLMGLFANTVSFVSTSDPAGYVKTTRDVMKDLNGKEMEGIKATVEYKPEAVDVAGVKADTWSMTLGGDNNDPQAAQVQMMMGMLFGQGGMGGMTAPVESGVVSTLSQNTPLFTKAIDAAKSGKGLSEDEQIKTIQKQLPEKRTFELYLGTKSILDAVNAAMGMFGGGTDIKVPAKVSPVGLAGATDGGGVDIRLYVPTDVIKTVASIAESMKGGEDGGDAAPAAGGDKDKPKSPRF
jgi:hypothetical protein